MEVRLSHKSGKSGEVNVWHGRWSALFVCVWLGVSAGPAIAGQVEWLITPDEASLAPPSPDQMIRSRGLTNTGPRIEIIKPAEDSQQASPFEIQIRFHPRTSAVNPESVKVQLVKFISIDITDRVKPFLSESGIEVKEAKIPSGSHLVRISVSDEQGESSSREIELEVK